MQTDGAVCWAGAQQAGQERWHRMAVWQECAGAQAECRRHAWECTVWHEDLQQGGEDSQTIQGDSRNGNLAQPGKLSK